MSPRRPERHEQGTRPARRPADQPQGRPGDLRTRAPRCTSPARRSTPTTWSDRTKDVAARLAAAGAARARHGHRPADRRRPTQVPGVVRVLTAADVPGLNDAGEKHDEPLFPDEVMFYGHAVCWVLGETARGGPAGRRGRSRSTTSRCRRWSPCSDAIAADSFQGHQRTVSRGDADAGLARGGAPVHRRVRVRRPGALLPGDQRRAGPGRRERPDLRPVQHPAPVRDPGHRRPRARAAAPTRSPCSACGWAAGSAARSSSRTVWPRSPRWARCSPAAR